MFTEIRVLFDPDESVVHSPERARRLLCAAVIWQGYLDLSNPHPGERWNAQQFFYSDRVDEYAMEIGLDMAAARERLVAKGFLPEHVQPPDLRKWKLEKKVGHIRRRG